MSNSNPIILKSQSDIGKLSAENDDAYLFDCFITNNYYNEIFDVNSPKMVLSGRTGSGKSAVIRYIHRNAEHSAEVDLQNMSMDYIANSDVINFLFAMNADVDLIFQSLWKHVLCIELIRLLFDVRNEVQSQSLFQRFRNSFADDSRKKNALVYLENWASKFWVDMDVNLREVTQNFETKMEAEFGPQIKAFKMNAGYERTLGNEKRTQLQTRIKKIVNSQQLAELSRVLDLLKDEVKKGQKQYYILFDRLDEKWADESIKYILISSLFEVLRSFRKIDNLKIAIAIRTDLLEKTLKSHSSIGYQRDKFGDILQEVSWTKSQLFNLVNTRIDALFKRKYTTENVSFYDIFCKNIGQIDTFDYMISRTQMRPREILDFVNRCIAASEGEGMISASKVRKTEVQYSIVRLESIADEWRVLYPTLDDILTCIKGFKKNFSFADFLNSTRIDRIIEKVTDSNYSDNCAIQISILSYLSDTAESNKKNNIATNIVQMLYHIGILGVKREANLTMQWSDFNSSVLQFDDLNNNFRMQFHDTYDLSLNVRP